MEKRLYEKMHYSWKTRLSVNYIQDGSIHEIQLTDRKGGMGLAAFVEVDQLKLEFLALFLVPKLRFGNH